MAAASMTPLRKPLSLPAALLMLLLQRTLVPQFAVVTEIAAFVMMALVGGLTGIVIAAFGLLAPYQFHELMAGIGF